MFEKDDDINIEEVEEIASLLHKHLKNELSSKEKHRLDSWRNQSALNQLIYDQVSEKGTVSSDVKEYYYILQQIESIRKRHSAERTRVVDMFSKKTVWPRYVAAAAVIFILIGGYFYFNDRPQQAATSATTSMPVTDEIQPAHNKAVLTLASGSHIELDSATTGIIAEQENTTIKKKQDGSLEYTPSTEAASSLAYNTVTTPRGGKYELLLPDGSRVWLNAASSLRFPVAFNGSDRRVELTGEAYFEIASSTYNSANELKKRPFIVSVNGSEVEVLGTHFNINAHSDEAEIRTTLLEGSVKITPSSSRKSEILKPGQQAIVDNTVKSINVINKKHPESSIAWIKGKFVFEKASIKKMMQELSRWYDIQVIYIGEIPTNTITGEIDNTIPLQELLSTLEKMGSPRFKIEGRVVKVIPG